METKVKKWGNSLAVRIPRGIVAETDLREGSIVSFQTDERSIILRRQRKPRYTLSELLKSTKKSAERRKEFDWGKSIGREIW